MSGEGLDLERAREVFDSSQDFTIGLEEEFAIIDPATLELSHSYEELHAACQEDGLLCDSAAGELIDTEIEIRSGRGETFADSAAAQREHRSRLFALAESKGLGLAATGTHPWANYLDQRIIDTEHYRRLEHDLGWVARRNNTWSLHVHVGVRGADRAIAVCDRMRELLPPLLAASANSPFLDERDAGLHSVRTEIFTRVFPRCGIHEPFGDWQTYADFVAALERTGSIVESTQLWWSVRPHHLFGTVEVRICDAQTRGEESLNIAALMSALVGQCALDYDAGGPAEPLGGRYIEENLWRSIRYGLGGEHIDWRTNETKPVRAVLEELIDWSRPAAAQMGLEVSLPERNGAQRGIAAREEGKSIREIYAQDVAETKETYAPKEAIK
jgi:carboxylate-amine ligase